MVDYTPIAPNSAEPEVAVNAALAAFEAAIDAIASGSSFPPGGTAGQLLAKTANGLAWVNPVVDTDDELPSGGSAGQALVRTSDGGVAWATISGGGGGGVSYPPGGTTGQVLKKTSNADNAVAWADDAIGNSGGGSGSASPLANILRRCPLPAEFNLSVFGRQAVKAPTLTSNTLFGTVMRDDGSDLRGFGGAVRQIPSGQRNNFTFIGRVTGLPVRNNNSSVGIIISNGTGGSAKAQFAARGYGVGGGTGCGPYGGWWTGSAYTDLGYNERFEFEWFRVIITGNIAKFYISQDASEWMLYETRDFGEPITHYGFAVHKYDTGIPFVATIPHFESTEFPGYILGGTSPVAGGAGGGAATPLAIPANSTAAAPGIPVIDDADTGVYSPGANRIGLSGGGKKLIEMLPNGNALIGVTEGVGTGYDKAGVTNITGGGLITWGGVNTRLKWTQRFLVLPVPFNVSSAGYIDLICPNVDIPAARVHDGQARSANADGILLSTWEALYAEHTPGGDQTQVIYHIVRYTTNFNAPSNWIFIAVTNADDSSIKMCNGEIVQAGRSSRIGISDLYLPTIPVDNTVDIGSAANRFKTVFATTGAINTSDAREKTAVEKLSEPEISAALALSKEVGAFKYLEAIELKGQFARTHVGMTVQRAIEIMTYHGLDPMAYAFICHDKWEGTEAVPVREADDVSEGVPAVPAVPPGDRYGFRVDQLNLFIGRGLAERLSLIEQRLADLEA